MKLSLSTFLLSMVLQGQNDPSRQANDLVDKLRSDRVDERDQAIRKLRDMGELARPALTRAAKDKDQEVASRALQVLEALDCQLGQQAFKKIEDAIGGAKSVKVILRWWRKDVTGPGAATLHGTVLLKNENKAFVSIATDAVLWEFGRSDERAFARKPNGMPVPKHLRDVMSVYLIRSGVLEPFIAGMNAKPRGPVDKEPKDPDGSDIKNALELSDFKIGDDEEGVKTLTYKLTDHDCSIAYQVKLWYDAKTLGLKKRTLSGKEAGVDTVYIEVYDEFHLDVDIPDERFKPPEK